jgi:SH3-like domain-containing protein
LEIVEAGNESPPVGGQNIGPAHAHAGRRIVSKNSEPVRIVLTDEQKAQIKDATGKEASAIELSAEELEERTMPAKVTPAKASPI